MNLWQRFVLHLRVNSFGGWNPFYSPSRAWIHFYSLGWREGQTKLADGEVVSTGEEVST